MFSPLPTLLKIIFSADNPREMADQFFAHEGLYWKLNKKHQESVAKLYVNMLFALD